MFMWHEKHYVGAAHGIVGIMFMLLQVKKIGIYFKSKIVQYKSQTKSNIKKKQ